MFKVQDRDGSASCCGFVSHIPVSLKISTREVAFCTDKRYIYGLKRMIMSTAEMRAEIQSYLEKVEDESFLKVVHSMLGTYVQEQEDPIEGYDLEGRPMRASELMDKYEAGIAAVKAGNYITVEELREKSNKWPSSTK